MRLRNAVVMAVVMLAGFLLVAGFQSAPAVRELPDEERSGGIAGDTIVAGMVLSIDYSYNPYCSASYDTGSWVIRSSEENDSYVIGIALNDALPLQKVKWATHGVFSCKVDASDSSLWGTSLSELTACDSMLIGAPLSASQRDGFLGAADCNISNPDTGQAISGSNVVGWLMEAITDITDTGALTTYDVLIQVR